jgi:hypothetical protein
MNRKKIIYSLSMLALTALAAYNASINIRENGMSDISLSNVEALAQESDIPGCIPVKGTCYTNSNGIKLYHITLE